MKDGEGERLRAVGVDILFEACLFLLSTFINILSDKP